MSIWVILIEKAAFSAIFTAIVFFAASGDRKHSPAAIHNYPPDIQEEYFKTHERVDVSYRSKKVILTLYRRGGCYTPVVEEETEKRV